MAKRSLIVARHADALPATSVKRRPVCPEPGVTALCERLAAVEDLDRARQLSEAGRRQAVQLGIDLQRHEIEPQYVLVSSALRTQQTWELASKAFPHSDPLLLQCDSLYEADSGEIVNLVRKLPPLVETAIIIGHFPGVADYCERISCDESDLAALTQIKDRFQTATWALFEANSQWTDWLPETARLVSVSRPQPQRLPSAEPQHRPIDAATPHNVPIWFIDIDGVINALSKGGRFYQKSYRQAEIVIPVGDLAWPLEVTWRPKVIDFINRAHRSHLVEVHWLTTWGKLARTHFAPLVGLDDFTHTYEQPDNANAGSSIRWKLDVIRNTPGIWDRNFIFTDDDLSEEFQNGLRNEFVKSKPLLIRPFEQIGLSDEHLRLIDKYIQRAN